MCRQQESDTLSLEPVQSPAARPVQGPPLPTHVGSARTPEGERVMAAYDAEDLVAFQDLRSPLPVHLREVH